MFFINLIVRLQNIRKRFCFCFMFRKFKRIVLFEAYNHYSLSFLWNAEIKPVENLVMHEISQFLQMLQNHLESTPPVMCGKLFYILQQKRFRLFRFQNSFNIKKQGPTRVGKPQFIADNAKRLARKTASQNIMIWHFVSNNFRNVPEWFFSKICFIHNLARLVPFGSENAFSARALKSDTDTANARKQVYEFEFFAVSIFHSHLIKSSTPTCRALATFFKVSIVGF